MNARASLLATSLLALSTGLGASAAYANGVPAGTLIENTASASYTNGASTTTVQSNTVTVRVDELLDVAVASLDGAPRPIGTGDAVLSFRVTNTGNGPEAFNLLADPAVGGNAFNATVQGLAVDSNGNGVYDPGVDAPLANGAPSAVLAADTPVTVFVIVSAPAGANDGAASQVRLTATAATGSGTPGTAFAGRGDGGGDAVTGASGAQDDAAGALRASLASVTLLKSFTVADPFGGAQPVPGATVTFTIRADGVGSGQVSGLRIADAIPAGTTYKPGTLRLDGATLSDAADGDAGTGSAAGIEVVVGTLAGGASRTVTFGTTID